MLAEWLTSLAADCPADARRLGYLHESIAIRSRHRRCKTAWQPHLDRSRAALLSSLEGCDRFRTALVMGSGQLLDVPLDELAQRFERVLLVDLVHLPEARKAARHHANVSCIEHDVTGFLEHRDALAPSRLALPAPSRFRDDPGIDWVASVNLVSQLPLLPSVWLARRFPELDEATLYDFGTALMRRHLDYLAEFDAAACLIADLEQVVEHGGEIERIDFGSRLGLEDRIVEQWRWDIAPEGEIAPGVSSHHRVARCRITR